MVLGLNCAWYSYILYKNRQIELNTEKNTIDGDVMFM